MGVRWSNPVRGALRREAECFAFASIQSAVRHCRTEGTVEDMCFFVGHKYEGGRYRVWDPKRRLVVESRELFSLRTACRRPLSTTYCPGPSTRTSQYHSPYLATVSSRRPHQCARAVPTVRGNADGLARGHAPACIGANTSSAHHHMPTRAQDEQASRTYRARSGRGRRHRRG